MPLPVRLDQYVPKPPVSPYLTHCDRWKDGCGSSLCEVASQVVFARGDIPCDVAFIGEAPGISENSTGFPFVGPAGKLLDRIVEEARREIEIDGSPWNSFTAGFGNLVGCIPLDETGRKGTEPSGTEIIQCSPRLDELLTIFDPKLIVCVGATSRQWLGGRKIRTDFVQRFAGPVVDITHPAAIIRMSVAYQELEIQKCVIILRDAVEALPPF